MPSLLKNGKVEAISSYVPRVVMTMYELCHELARCYSGIEVTTSEGKQFNPLMRYFTVDTAYVAYLKDGRGNLFMILMPPRHFRQSRQRVCLRPDVRLTTLA